MAWVISKELEEAANQRNLELLRELVAGRIYASPDFSRPEFHDALNYLQSRGIDIFQPFEGVLVSKGKTEFTDQDFSRAIFELKRNFCRERIEDAKKIGKAICPSSSPQPAPQGDDPKNLPSLQRPTFLGAIRNLFRKIRSLFRQFFSGQKRQ